MAKKKPVGKNITEIQASLGTTKEHVWPLPDVLTLQAFLVEKLRLQALEDEIHHVQWAREAYVLERLQEHVLSRKKRKKYLHYKGIRSVVADLYYRSFWESPVHVRILSSTTEGIYTGYYVDESYVWDCIKQRGKVVLVNGVFQTTHSAIAFREGFSF